MKRIAILNGPNLDRLGKRDPEIYGTSTLDDVASGLKAQFPNVEFDFFQSNHEGLSLTKYPSWPRATAKGSYLIQEPTRIRVSP